MDFVAYLLLVLYNTMLLLLQANKQTNTVPLYGCSEWFVQYHLLWESRTDVRVLLVCVGAVIVRVQYALPSVCMGCAISFSVVRTRKGSPALEHRSPSEAQMPGCKQLLRPLLYCPFPSWFRFHVRACRGRTCSEAESSLGEGCRGWCRESLRVTG